MMAILGRGGANVLETDTKNADGDLRRLTEIPAVRPLKVRLAPRATMRWGGGRNRSKEYVSKWSTEDGQKKFRRIRKPFGPWKRSAKWMLEQEPKDSRVVSRKARRLGTTTNTNQINMALFKMTADQSVEKWQICVMHILL